MKRMIFTGLLALGCLAASQKEASAWGKFTFGAGFHMSWELPAIEWGFHFRCVEPHSCHHGYDAGHALPPSGFDPAWNGYAQSYTDPRGAYGQGAGYHSYGDAAHFYGGYQQGPGYWYH